MLNTDPRFAACANGVILSGLEKQGNKKRSKSKITLTTISNSVKNSVIINQKKVTFPTPSPLSTFPHIFISEKQYLTPCLSSPALKSVHSVLTSRRRICRGLHLFGFHFGFCLFGDILSPSLGLANKCQPCIYQRDRQVIAAKHLATSLT